MKITTLSVSHKHHTNILHKDKEAQNKEKMADKAVQKSGTENSWQSRSQTWTESAWCCGPSLGRAALTLKWFAFRSMFAYPLHRIALSAFGYSISYGEILGALIGAAILAMTVITDGGTGVTSIPLVITFLVANRNSVWAFLLGMPFERALPYHKAIAIVAIAAGVIHGVEYGMNGSGLVLVICMGLLLVTAQQPIRRYFFNFFYGCHWVLIVLVLGSGFAHGVGALAPALIFILFDVGFRLYLARSRLPRTVTAACLPAGIIRISFPKPANFDYSGGQYCFLCVPKLGLFEWHPFSFSSSPSDSHVMLHIRPLGDWTSKLYNHIKTSVNATIAMESAAESESAAVPKQQVEEGHVIGSMELSVMMEGPYGAPMIDIASDRYKMAVLVSGGIGITPMQSVCNELIDQTTHEGRPFKNIWFVWSVQERSFVEAMFPPETTGHRQMAMEDGVGNLPPSFSPNLLRKFDHEEKGLSVSYAFHLTQKKSSDKFDPSVHDKIQEGRPNIRELFEKVHATAKAKGEKRVAVMCCGPTGLMRDTRRYAKEFSRDGVRMDYHHETFEF